MMRPAAAAPAGDDIVAMLVFVILVVCERDEFIACRIGELAQRFAHALGDAPGPRAFRTLRGHANDRREERRRYFFCSQFHHRRIIHEERIPRHRPSPPA